MTTNLRVVPPGLHKGAILVALVFGPITAGLMYIQVELLVEHVFMNNLPSWVEFAAFASVLVVLSIPFLWVVLLDATSQRRWTMAAASAVGYLSLALTIALAALLIEFTGDISMRWIDLLYVSAWIGGVMLAAALAALLLRFLTRWLIVRTVEQTGSLCWTCAYDLSATAPNHPCPECGTNPATNRPRRRAIIGIVRFCNRHAVKAIILLAVVSLSVIGWRLATWVYPVLQLRAAVNAVPGFAQAYTNYASGSSSAQRLVEMAVSIPGHDNRRIIITDGVTADPSDVPMMLAVGHVWGNYYYRKGDSTDKPPVRITLSPDQARHVRRNGIPPELIAAMNERWQAARAEYGTLMSQGDDTSHLESKYALDPAPFFPPSPR